MDQGRLADIKRLNDIINNPNKTKGARRAADRTKKAIVAQLRDPKLRRLRYQLINAARHYDEKTELKLMNTIKDYLKQEKIEV